MEWVDRGGDWGYAVPAMKPMIRVGTSGFQFEDWVGTVYPEGLKQAERLGYYETALGFNTVEVNYTYYKLPFPRTMEGMMRKTSDSFDFVVRSYKEMTHEIWEDPRRTKLKDNRVVFEKFREGLKPLIREKRLGCVLIQFPYFFVPKDENFDYILRCKKQLPGIDLVIEFRHRAWVKEKTFEFLRKNKLGFCILDEPQLSRLMPLTFVVTSDIAYVRFHGRNKNWFGASKEDRYHYNYSEDELRKLVPEIKGLSPISKRLYLFFNNCTFGFAAKNAALMKKMLG